MTVETGSKHSFLINPQKHTEFNDKSIKLTESRKDEVALKIKL